MASISQLTEEERNFTRYFFLNFKVSPDITRRFFDGVFPPAHLAQTINSSMPVIIKLNKSKRINAAQLEILRGVPGTAWPSYLPTMTPGAKGTSSKEFDLTMMICLLRNLGGLSAPSNGWDQLPHPNDKLPGAHLATLKWCRNQLAHTTVTSMDNNEFTDKWNRVEKALTSLNKGQRPHEVIEIVNYDLDGEQAKSLANTELKELKKEYLDWEKEKEQVESDFIYYRKGNLPKNIAEANATMVETWLEDDETFYETEGSELVYDKLQDCSCILVTSNSGVGKTATIRHIALKFKMDGFEIVNVPVETPEYIIKYKRNNKQVFLIDDVLGKYSLSPTLLEKWERINEKLMSCFETELDSNKILCTLRLQIANHKRFKSASTILNKEVINLESESNALSKEEKQKILIKHLKRNDLEKEIKTGEIEIMCETQYAFPLLCKIVANDEERWRKRLAFFKNPTSLLRNELDNIRNENKKLYCILVICMLYNGSFSKSILDIDSNECDEKIYRIMQTCELERNTSKKELEDILFSAIGSYLTNDGYNFQFIHDTFKETIGCHFCRFNPKVLFSFCDILFIRDRVRVHSIENINENDDENFVIIQKNELNENLFDSLFNRLSDEVNSGRFSSLLMSQLFKNRDFVYTFGTRYENNQGMLGSTHPFLKKVSSERIGSHLIRHVTNLFETDQSVSVAKRVKEICLSNKEFLEKKDAISRVIEAIAVRSTLLHWIVAFGCNELFQYAWSKMTSSEQKWILGRDYTYNPLVKSFFPLAVLGGSLDIVTELICSGADVNCVSEFWETPLYVAVKSDRYDMIHLLVKNGAHVNLRGWFAMKIPIAVPTNKQELTSLILEYDLNQTELHKAVRHNDLENLRSNIRSDNIDSKTKSGWTVLHYAVLLDNKEAMNVLFHKGLPQDGDSCFAVTQVDKESELLCREPLPKINIADNNGITAMHLAVINDNIEMISTLLRYKAEVKVRDVFNRTPLHYVNSERAIKLLLTHSSQNLCSGDYQSFEEGGVHGKILMSVFRTMCFNITVQNSFRNIGRDFINKPDREGNTPLHSVINKCLLKKEITGCIETLLENGANPYLVNDSGISSIELVKSSSDTVKYINNSENYKQLNMKTYNVFALVMFILTVLTFGLSIYLSSLIILIRQESEKECSCVGQVANSGGITLVKVTRSINVILFTIVLFWLFSITFYVRWSVLLQRCFGLFFVLTLLGCGSFILFGPFVCIQFIYRFMYGMIVVVIICSIFIKLMSNLTPVVLVCWNRGNIAVLMCFLLLIFSVFYVFVSTASTDDHKFDNFYFMRKINTLNITTSNCTDFNSVNITCKSLACSITYKNGVDFSVQCRTDPNITSYNGTHGTLTVESGFIDWSEIGLMCLFCLNLSLHATCAFCFSNCMLIIIVMKIFCRLKSFPLIIGVAMSFLYLDILCQMMF